MKHPQWQRFNKYISAGGKIFWKFQCLNQLSNGIHLQQRKYQSFSKKKIGTLKAMEAMELMQNLHRSTNKNQIADKAFEIYIQISEEKNSNVINELLNIYLKYKPENILNGWNSILNSINIDNTSYQLTIKCCTNAIKNDNMNNIHKYIQIFDCIQTQIILNDNIIIKTCLINAYGLCSNIENAENIFNSVSNTQKDSILIGVMMRCYINNNYNNKALSLFQKYASLKDDRINVMAIKACMNMNDYQTGKDIIESSSNKININLSTAMISFYSKYGDIDNAIHIFNSINSNKRDMIFVASMMKCCLDNNENKKGLLLYTKSKRFHCDMLHNLAIKACSNLNEYNLGLNIINSNINVQYLCTHSLSLLNTLINFYGTFKDIDNAWNVFNTINDSKKDLVTLNSMLKSLINVNQNELAISLYNKYNKYHKLNDYISQILALKACINLNDFDTGKRIINLNIDWNNIPKYNIELLGALINFYGECNDICMASKVFDLISDNKRNAICIGSMMKCLFKNNQNQETILLHQKCNGLNDIVSHLFAIKACTNIGDYKYGKKIIKSTINYQTNNNYSLELYSSLIDFYGKFGDICSAADVFNAIKHKDIICIASMMNAYCLNEMNHECIQLFSDYFIESNNDYAADSICYNIVLIACTQTTSLYFGIKIHEMLKNESNKELLNDLSIQICLISMYGKCNQLDLCNDLFTDIKCNQYDKYLNEIDIWHSMMNSFARNGYVNDTMNLFYKMKAETSLIPDDKTYSILLNACSHSGDVDQAQNVWNNQIIDDNIRMCENVITPFIDCISKKGLLNEAYQIILECEKKMISNGKHQNCVKSAFGALFAGCKKYKNVEFGTKIYNEIESRFNDDKAYMTSASVCLSNLHVLNV